MIDFIKDQILSNQLFSTAFILSISAAIVLQLKGVPKIIWQKIQGKSIFTVKVYQYDPLYYVFENWLYLHAKNKYRTIEAGLNKKGYVEYPAVGEEKEEQIYYRQESGFFLIRYKKKWLMIRKNSEKMDNAKSLSETFFKSYSIQGIHAKNVIDAMLQDSLLLDAKSQNDGEIKVYNANSYGEWEMHSFLKPKDIESVVLEQTKKQEILQDIDQFITQQQWYAQTGIPYKRGYCFYGDPGNGKTSLALAISTYLNRNIYYLNLNELERDTNLKRAISRLPKNAIMLIEDIDRIYSGRNSVRKDFKISFSTLLNCMDGVFFQEGLIVIITTNHIDQLDPALIRPGRIDKVVEISQPAKPQIESYLTKFYGKALSINGYKGKLSMSEVQNICLQNISEPESAIIKINNTINN